MSHLAQEEKAHRFCGMAAGTQRVGISEFARGKAWRHTLDESGCVEVTDRAGTIGLLLTPDYADDVSSYISQLEAELEQAYVRALFDMRRDYSEPAEGAALATAALAEFDARESKIRNFLDGGE